MLGIKYTIKKTLYCDVVKVYAKRGILARGKWVKIAEVSLFGYTEETLKQLLSAIVKSYGFDNYIVEY